MYRTIMFLLLAPALAVAAQDQPALQVTPDTLFVHETFENPFLITNAGSQPITLNSILFDPDGEYRGGGVAYLLTANGDVYEGEGIMGFPEYHSWFPDWTVDGLTLDPDSTAELRIWAIGYCAVCRDPEAYIPVHYYWNDNQTPTVRTVGFNFPLSTKPDSQIELPLISGPYPNPASSTAQIEIQLRSPKQVQLVVVSALGKTVENRNLGAMSVGDHSIPIHVGNLAPGIYFVRIVFGGAHQQHSVVRRLVVFP